MIVLYMLLFINGLCNFVVDTNSTFWPSFTASYQTMFGENLENMETEKTSRQALYFIFTNLINIIILNILISIVTDNYDNVNQRILAIDYTKKAAMMYEYEVLFRQCCKKKKDIPKYLFLISYADRPREEEELEQQLTSKFR